MRTARQFIWIDADDCFPPHGLDMESERDRSKVEMLATKFEKEGFDINFPALVGYPKDGKIQLLSGTHRHRAAAITHRKLPVTIWLQSDIQRRWGTDLWPATIADIPVKDLEECAIIDGFNIPPYDPVEL